MLAVVRFLGLKNKIDEMTVQEAVDLFSSNGNLVKRPFVISTDGGAVGFCESVWEELFL